MATIRQTVRLEAAQAREIVETVRVRAVPVVTRTGAVQEVRADRALARGRAALVQGQVEGTATARGQVRVQGQVERAAMARGRAGHRVVQAVAVGRRVV
jgi:hypothetical protein